MNPHARLALLRGINVSGQKLIKMAELRVLLEKKGFRNISTYIQSGNVVFLSPAEPSALSEQLHGLFLDHYGWDIPTLVTTGADWESIARANPFLARAGVEAKYLYVHVLGKEPDPEIWNTLNLKAYLPEEAVWKGRAIYGYMPNGYGKAQLLQGFWEKKLRVAVTSRNLNTVEKLREMLEAL